MASVNGKDRDGADDPFGLVGHTLDDRFRIESVVAEGGFGVVYRAQHLSLARPVAVKVLKLPADVRRAKREKFMARFAQEARTVARLQHPNIVQVLDHGAAALPTGEPVPYMVMEWVEGPTLDATLRARRKQGGRPPAACLALLRDAFEAVAAAHAEGVAHRDLKPANIIVATTRRGPTLRLLDFGTAKIMEPDEAAGSGSTMTMSTNPAYTPKYAAPEQLGGYRSGPWTDVHALGLIVTEVLTDRPPYGSKELAALVAEVVGPVRPTPARRGVDVGAWEPVIARAVALAPGERFPDAGALLAALEEALPRACHAPLGARPSAPSIESGAPSAEPPSAEPPSVAPPPPAPPPSAPREHAPTLAAPFPVSPPAPAAPPPAPEPAAPSPPPREHAPTLAAPFPVSPPAPAARSSASAPPPAVPATPAPPPSVTPAPAVAARAPEAPSKRPPWALAVVALAAVAAVAGGLALTRGGAPVDADAGPSRPVIPAVADAAPAAAVDASAPLVDVPTAPQDAAPADVAADAAAADAPADGSTERRRRRRRDDKPELVVPRPRPRTTRSR